MREGWEKVRIGDLGRVVTGRTPPSIHPEYFGDAFQFVTPGDMHVDKRVWATSRYVSNAGADFLKRICLPARTVCVSCIGWQMGNVVMTTADAFTNQQLNSVITNERVVRRSMTRRSTRKNVNTCISMSMTAIVMRIAAFMQR